MVRMPRPVAGGKTMPRRAPQAAPETQEFWDGVRIGELRLQRCTDCQHVYFPPRPFCEKCASRNVEWFKASGKGTLYSYIINHRPRPDISTEPHAIAVVQLAEGPRMMTNIVDCPQTPEALQLDMPLELSVEPVEGGALPLFRPAK